MKTKLLILIWLFSLIGFNIDLTHSFDYQKDYDLYLYKNSENVCYNYYYTEIKYHKLVYP